MERELQYQKRRQLEREDEERQKRLERERELARPKPMVLEARRSPPKFLLSKVDKENVKPTVKDSLALSPEPIVKLPQAYRDSQAIQKKPEQMKMSADFSRILK